MDMTAMNQIVGDIDSFVWGPVMLCLLGGYRNLPYGILEFPYMAQSALCDEKRVLPGGP